MSVSITTQFLNQDKRETEAITVTLPAVLDAGGGRANAPAVHAQYEETYLASVAPKESIIGKSYIVVEEAFTAATTVNVSIGGTAVFTEQLVDATGIFISATEDILLTAGGDVSINISSTADALSGDVLVGKLRVVHDYIPYNQRNGRFSAVPV